MGDMAKYDWPMRIDILVRTDGFLFGCNDKKILKSGRNEIAPESSNHYLLILVILTLKICYIFKVKNYKINKKNNLTF